MPRHKYSNTTLPYAPLAPLPPTQTGVWLPTDGKLKAFRLGNLASVDEITNHPDESLQRWRYTICAIGGEKGVSTTRDDAFRKAEFYLGKGECPMRLPEIASGKKGGVA